MNFGLAFDRLMPIEGGLSMRSDDPGNWTGGGVGVGELKGTKYGISAASYPTIDIKALTKDAAKALYFRDFWNLINADRLYDGVAWAVFDFAVNSGPQTAIRYLQRALKVADDGHWGPVSAAAAATMSESDQIMRINALRLKFMVRLSNWRAASGGWANRIADNLLFGAEDS